MEISIIILSYKMKRLVRNCLRAIRESSIAAPYEIIVVDNGSNDGIEQLMAEQFPDVKLIVSRENLGMGRGNNLGLAQARGRYVLIMNPDIYVYPDSIQRLYDYVRRHPEIGLAAPRLLNPDKSLQYTCYRWHQVLTPLYRRTALGRLGFAQKQLDHFLMKDFDHQQISQVDWCQGSCFMAPKPVFDQVGNFDDRFFMYFEDTDLCRRMWRHGYQVVYLGNVEMIHMHMRMSRGGMNKIITNRLTREHIKSWAKYAWKYRGEGDRG